MRSKYILISVIILFILVSGIIYGIDDGEESVHYILGPRDDSHMDYSGEKVEDQVLNIDKGTDKLLETSMTVMDSQSLEQEIVVHIHGFVTSEGVYKLDQGARVYEALALAGGLTEEGSSRMINQARFLVDGESIYFPSVDEEVEMEATKVLEEINDPRIDINKADRDRLMELPGIGDTKARSIIAYRQLNGGFKNAEEIMSVSGIKESLYESLKGLIKVSD